MILIAFVLFVFLDLFELTCFDLLHASVFICLICFLQLVKVNDGTCQYEGIGELVLVYELVCINVSHNK